MNETLEMIIKLVILPLIPVVVGVFTQAVRKWVERQSVEIENEVIKGYMGDILEAIIQAVTNTSQTYVDSLKKQGKFDDEAQRIAFKKSKDTAMLLLAQDSKDFITRMYGDLDLWLDTKIEQIVKELK